MCRPTKYKPEYCELVHKLCLLGAKDKELADILGVHESTFHEWKEKHPRFRESINEAKELADATVAQSLYKSAVGFTVEEETVEEHNGVKTSKKVKKHVPGNVRAQELWLRNRRRKNWRDETNINVNVNVGLDKQLKEGRQKVTEQLQKSPKELLEEKKAELEES